MIVPAFQNDHLLCSLFMLDRHRYIWISLNSVREKRVSPCRINGTELFGGTARGHAGAKLTVHAETHVTDRLQCGPCARRENLTAASFDARSNNRVTFAAGGRRL